MAHLRARLVPGAAAGPAPAADLESVQQPFIDHHPHLAVSRVCHSKSFLNGAVHIYNVSMNNLWSLFEKMTKDDGEGLRVIRKDDV